MKLFAHASLIAIAVSAAAAAAQDVPQPAPTSPGGFRLPTTPTPTPNDVQGPVDPDAPILTRPRAAPTPTPTPRAVPTPTPTPEPRPVPRAAPAPTPAPRSTQAPGSTLPPRFTPPAAPTAQESAEATATSAELFPDDPTVAASEPALPVPGAAVPPAATAPAEDEGGSYGWLLALAGLAAAAGAGAVWWRRRSERPVAPAIIEPPRIVPPVPAGAPAPAAKAAAAASPAAPAATPGPQLRIDARAIKLSRSMMFATLSYELIVTNRSSRALEGVRFGGDLVTAHARIPTNQQLADPAVPLAPMKDIERLEPGESARLAGELRLPVAQIRPIPHGRAVVYVPLLRVRAESAGMEPVARTFVVGLLPQAPGQNLQPFRLDEMPQTYSAVGQKPLD
ncbi:hypothetical protein [Tsuneonella amylolytica]|uniref:hypothetical protein n=1 Tax=Tsuneonella amylolytica TaxID=2338327 RepID=UPI000EA8B814|nr:hypothetical protein [Tsuneonella amylolytica]